MADPKHGHPQQGTEPEVRHQDWDGRDLSGETHTRVAFADVDMTETTNAGAVFDMCTFGIVKVFGGEWSFVGLAGADLRSATLENVRMREADLTGARLDGATVRGVDLSGAWLHSAKLSGCDLRGSDLSSVDPLTVELNRTIIDVDQAVSLAVALGLDVRPE